MLFSQVPTRSSAPGPPSRGSGSGISDTVTPSARVLEARPSSRRPTTFKTSTCSSHRSDRLRRGRRDDALAEVDARCPMARSSTPSSSRCARRPTSLSVFKRDGAERRGPLRTDIRTAPCWNSSARRCVRGSNLILAAPAPQDDSAHILSCPSGERAHRHDRGLGRAPAASPTSCGEKPAGK